jgi:hypothetical protein
MTSSVTVQLGNEPGDEPGALRYTVNFPDTVSEASLVLVSLGGGEDSEPADLLAGSALSGGVRTKTGVLNAEAGNYLLILDLYDSAGNAGKSEIVHIYSNTETPGAYSFSAGDFSPTSAYQTGSGQSLNAALTAIGGASGTDFTVLMEQDETAFAPFTLDAASFAGKKVRIRGRGHTVTLDGGSTGSLFTLESGVVLVTQDTEMRGRGTEFDNSGALITVTGGELLVNPGTVITGNNSSSSGGGVVVSGGAFTMSGGSVSANSGSGVVVSGGAFTMSGGSVSANSGSGVYVSSGTFTMSGGSITGNSSSSSWPSGGGVYVSSGTFTMSGGSITGNSITGNSSSSYYYSGGGGVYVYSSGAFTMNGGSVSGNSASDWLSGGGVFVGSGASFTMNGGSVSGNSASDWLSGGGVYVVTRAASSNISSSD